jgi:hypothetical protein
MELTMKIKRREFLGFFLIGGLVGLIRKRIWLRSPQRRKEAMFWRRKA